MVHQNFKPASIVSRFAIEFVITVTRSKSALPLLRCLRQRRDGCLMEFESRLMSENRCRIGASHDVKAHLASQSASRIPSRSPLNPHQSSACTAHIQADHMDAPLLLNGLTEFSVSYSELQWPYRMSVSLFGTSTVHI